MFRALLAHPQEVLHKLHLVYRICIMSGGCGTVAVKPTPIQGEGGPLILKKLNEKVHHVGFIILIWFIALLPGLC
jgi:hypothetical protein